jgi:hypothetical protein
MRETNAELHGLAARIPDRVRLFELTQRDKR